ncbi:hypothetical protein [Moraxella lacunata]|uniref:hypothetical protein n=1 Tax=Moraxella lacunata TaxID=477 RepID=UPI003EDE8B0A
MFFILKTFILTVQNYTSCQYNIEPIRNTLDSTGCFLNGWVGSCLANPVLR